jgi:Zn-finger nucleic acid-binding protein
MKCPVCLVELLASHRDGVEIDCCPNCGGIWLDHGELFKIVSFRMNRTGQIGERAKKRQVKSKALQ